MGKKDWKEKFKYCRVCGKPVPKLIHEWACKEYQQMTCSTKCLTDERLKQFACCERARFMHCVCHAAIKCPIHGTRHHGTHD